MLVCLLPERGQIEAVSLGNEIICCLSRYGFEFVPLLPYINAVPASAGRIVSKQSFFRASAADAGIWQKQAAYTGAFYVS